MKLSFVTLDVFTADRYTGNPLAVVHVPASLSKSLTQAQKMLIAMEFNLSETVFLHETDEAVVSIDIFTEEAEIPFAGHPTIGTACYVLGSKPSVTALRTKAGEIPVSLNGGYARAQIPQTVHIHKMTLSSSWTKTPAPVVSIVKGMTFILIELPDLATLAKTSKNLAVNTYDPTGLDESWEEGLLGSYYYVLLGTDDAGRKIVRTRMWGSREDSATGSAASALCGYLTLVEDKSKGDGPFEYAITQGVEMGRKSEIGVEVTRSEGKVGKIFLLGQAVQVMEGSLSA